MKIAIIAPPWNILPTEDYTGIESTISNLSEELIKEGKEVILFAPSGSTSSAELVHYPDDTSGLDWQDASDDLRHFFKNLIAKYASMRAIVMGADIIHNFTLSGETDCPLPVLYTVYGPPVEKSIEICEKISQYPNNYFVSVSNRQRILFSEISSKINFIDTVHKSIDTEKIKWESTKEDYFLFIGQTEQKQAVELAKRVADSAGIRLLAVIQGEKERRFKDEIKPWLDKDTVNLNLQFSEDLMQDARYDLYRKAKATFYVNQWEEPFGMEMLESLACGTPVIALRKGAAPEVIEDGKTGFLVETENEMIEAVKKIDKISTADCRKSAEENFSSKVIASKYTKIYNSILNRT